LAFVPDGGESLPEDIAAVSVDRRLL